jgi:hypothetical protein
MVHVMCEHMPHHIGTLQLHWLAIPIVGKGLLHIAGTPASQAIGHHVPGEVDGLGQLGSGWDGCTRLVPVGGRFHLRTAVLSQEPGEPDPTAANDMHGILADGAQARRGAQSELLGPGTLSKTYKRS